MVKSLHLAGFRCYADTTIQFGPLTVIHGTNGSGKSSIQDALAYLATGACRGTASDGKGAAEVLMRHGAHGFIVEAETTNGTISRGITLRTVSRGARAGDEVPEPVISQADQLLDMIGTSRRVFDLAVRPDAFSALHGRDQAAALLALAGVPVVRLEDILRAGAPDTIRKYADTLADATETDAGVALEKYFATQRRVETDRHAARKALDEARGARDAAQADVAGVRYSREDHAAAQARLRELRQQHQQLRATETAEESEHKGRRSQILTQQGALQRRLAEVQGRGARTVDTQALAARRAQAADALSSAQVAAGGASAAELGTALAKLGDVRPDLAKIEADLTTARLDQSAAQTRIPQIEARMAELALLPRATAVQAELTELAARREIAQLMDSGLPCPACYEAIDHGANEARIAVLESFTADAQAMEKAWATAQQELDALGRELARCTFLARGSGVEALEGERFAYDVAHSLRKQLGALEDVSRLERELRGLDRQIATASEGSDTAAEAERIAAETDALQAQLDELGAYVSPYTQRIAQLDADILAHIEDIERQERNRALVDMAVRRGELFFEAAERHEELDKLVIAMQGPVRIALFDERLQTLNKDLAATMGVIGSVDTGDNPPNYLDIYGAWVSMDDRGRLDLALVRQVGGESFEVPFSGCSASEQQRIVWALQCIAGHETKLVVLDAPESLDERFKYAPYDLGETLASGGIQVIVCAIQPPPGLTEWQRVRLDDGRVVEVTGPVARDASEVAA